MVKNGKWFKCGHCQNEIYRNMHRISRCKRGVFFCSQNCSNQFNKNFTAPSSKKEVPCNYCGQLRAVKKYQYEKESFFYCSRQCTNKCPERRKRLSASLTGKTISISTRQKLSIYKGKKASNWKGGKPICAICKKQINYNSVHCQKCKVTVRTKEHWGKIHKKASKTMRGKLPANMNRPGKWQNIKRDYFDINGQTIFLRSKWEANYALYLDYLKNAGEIISWQFEPDTFLFKGGGVHSYLPDFKIKNINNKIEYHEVKGRMTERARKQISLMAKQYPSVRLILIKQKEYNSMLKLHRDNINFF